tara:strand:- start:880 stop:1410 length:531 start_codon:yes stop_codon:yes gene_type:complete
MIFLKSNDEFYLKSVINLISQRKLPITIDKSDKHFFDLEIFFEKYQIKITSTTKMSTLKLPISFELFLSEIKNHFVGQYVKVGILNYEPINQSINYNQQVIYLNYIHNIIITNLILNTDMGVDKILLYKLIWSQDKNIQINKLDTHITNLKNKIKDSFNIDLKIVTNSGFLKLIVD